MGLDSLPPIPGPFPRFPGEREPKPQVATGMFEIQEDQTQKCLSLPSVPSPRPRKSGARLGVGGQALRDSLKGERAMGQRPKT